MKTVLAPGAPWPVWKEPDPPKPKRLPPKNPRGPRPPKPQRVPVKEIDFFAQLNRASRQLKDNVT